MKAELTPRQQRFVAEYLLTLNATQAAIKAGYSAKAARAVSSRLLTFANIVEAVAAGRARLFEKHNITAERVLEEIRRVAFADPRRVFDQHGNLKPIGQWGDEDAAVLASFEVIKKNAAAGDGHVDTVWKVKLWNKLQALELLCKRLGLLEPPVTDLPSVPMFALPNNSRGPAVRFDVIETKAIAGPAPPAQGTPTDPH